MRIPPFRRERFDGAILLDAFGFFETEDDNDAILANIARILVPHGPPPGSTFFTHIDEASGIMNYSWQHALHFWATALGIRRVEYGDDLGYIDEDF
jgi:hypothetical protein